MRCMFFNDIFDIVHFVRANFSRFLIFNTWSTSAWLFALKKKILVWGTDGMHKMSRCILCYNGTTSIYRQNNSANKIIMLNSTKPSALFFWALHCKSITILLPPTINFTPHPLETGSLQERPNLCCVTDEIHSIRQKERGARTAYLFGDSAL